MKRVEIMEFEDQSWFPSWLRSCMTNNIVVMARFLGVRHALSSLLSTALQKTGARSVVDLGSGAGGVMPGLQDKQGGRGRQPFDAGPIHSQLFAQIDVHHV